MGTPGGIKCGQKLVAWVSPYLFLSSTWPTPRSQHQIKSEHLCSVITADPGGRVWRGKQARPSRGKNLAQAYHPTILSPGQNTEQWQWALSDESQHVSVSWVTLIQSGLVPHSWHTATTLLEVPFASRLSSCFNTHTLLFSDELSCCGEAHPT